MTRGTTVPPHALDGVEIAAGIILSDEHDVMRRPRTRGDCEGGPRPCPWVSCRHHLYAFVSATGGLVLPWGEVPLETLAETCALDVAERGQHTLEDVGALMRITRERTRQIQNMGLQRLLDRLGVVGIEAEDLAQALAAEAST